MKLSISNIAWKKEDEEIILKYLAAKKFAAIEIAPTKIVGGNPYEKSAAARSYAAALYENYGLKISSMQSIWFGRTENIFGSEAERKILRAYTRAAIDFAAALGCANLVFGCPKNRVRRSDSDIETALSFFRESGSYAASRHVVLALEANPALYGTNFMNTTAEAVAVCKEIASPGVGVNFDFGAVIANEESWESCLDAWRLFHHVHLSEPRLALLEKRGAHREFLQELKRRGYEKYISIEMAEQALPDIFRCVDYVQDVIG